MVDALERSKLREAMNAYASELAKRVIDQAGLRQETESRWYADTRQYYGLYDEETEKRLAERKGSSKVFLNMTRPKTRVMRARITDVLLPQDESNWDIQPTPVPELEMAARERPDPQENPVGAEASEGARAEREQIRQRADAMRLEMEDQLDECNYAEVCRRVIDQACKIGLGVAKGPFADWRQKSVWEKVKDQWSLKQKQDQRPAFEWVDAWNFFPDMAAHSMEDCEYVFELHRMTRTELRQMARKKGFHAGNIRDLLRENPENTEFSEYSRYRKAFEGASDSTEEHRYYVLEYHGPIPFDSLQQMSGFFERGDILDAIGVSDDAEPLKSYHGVVWFCQDKILRFGISHLDAEEVPYSIFRIDPTDVGLSGYGVPALLRDSQTAVNAAWRMVLENGALSGAPIFIVDRSQLQPADGQWEFTPKKVYWRIAPMTEGSPAMELVSIAGNTANLMQIIDAARQFGDDETSLPLIAQGEQGPHVTKTAHGMSLLVNSANMIFRAAARNFDAEFTIPNIRRLYHWNMQFSKKQDIKGDLQVKAKGSSVLLMRELQAQNLLMVINLVSTNPLLTRMFRIPSLARSLVQALQLSKDKIVLTDPELEKLAAEMEPQPSEQEIKIAGQIELAKLHMQAEVLRLAQQSEMSVERIMADLEKVKMKLDSKERLAAAEIAVKQEMGTGF